MELSIIENLKGYTPEPRKVRVERRSLDKVLIVEDDLALASVLSEVIEELSPHTTIHLAASGEEAEFFLERESESGDKPYDLVIADIFLEGEITGLDLWKTCDMTYPETEILVTSSLPINKFKSYLQNEDSCPPYLAKPFTLNECIATINDFI